MAKRQPKSLKTVEVVAAALVAFRLHGNKVDRSPTPEGLATNKEMVLSYFDGTVPAGLQKPLVISALDIRDAERIRNFINSKVTMDVLVDKPVNNFEADLAKTIEADEVFDYKVGMVVYAPKNYFEGTKAADAQLAMAQIAVNSKFLGKPKDRVEFTFHLIDAKYCKNLDCYRHVGHDDDGNLVAFFNKNAFPDNVRVKARVKANDTKDGNSTYLHFVKVIA